MSKISLNLSSAENDTVLISPNHPHGRHILLAVDTKERNWVDLISFALDNIVREYDCKFQLHYHTPISEFHQQYCVSNDGYKSTFI
jgi:hypothetical protein